MKKLDEIHASDPVNIKRASHLAASPFDFYNVKSYPLPLWKRVMDVCIALLLIVILSPVFTIISIFIYVLSPGPIFFAQERVGHRGKLFRIYKFRSMHPRNDTRMHNEYLKNLIQNGGAMAKLNSDPRIIPLGNIIRATALDELPQLFNVLKGNMSLVGPRPAITYEVLEYDKRSWARFACLPGMTGLWQVRGKNRLSFQQMIDYDIEYAQSFSFKLDIEILIRTPIAIVQQFYDTFLKKSRIKNDR